jgi:signal transduction histidine kinase
VEPYVLFRLGSFGLVSALFAGLAARVRHARAVAERAQARSASAEAEAKAIGEQQERLVAVVGHDLRSPLFAINLTVELLRNVGQDPVRRSEGLLRIAKSAERMQSMVRDLLDFARARHGAGLPVHLRPLRLGDLCRAALEEVRTAQPSGTVVFDVSGDDSAALDPARVEQVVTNLVTNALQHGPAGAPVKVAVQGAGDAVRLTVMNQGPPIPTDLLATCFEPFRKGRASDSIGLGLFIVREIATAHGGSVSVASDGQETTFTVLFPRSSADADRLPAAGPRPPGALDY